ncbi:MAG: InlB B-repeat-containing protein [Firmicutes bacterium]|nr:InlB B-repeat-containing protein [Bacillota bacterium]
MKKRIKTILVLLTVLMCLFYLFGCLEKVVDSMFKEEGYFKLRIISDKDKTGCIENIVNGGQSQEVLVIPREVKGYRVVAIGNVKDFALNTGVVKKIYLQPGIEVYPRAFEDSRTLETVIFFEDTENIIALHGGAHHTVKFYFTSKAFARKDADYSFSWHRLLPANVSFVYNCAESGLADYNNGYYWIDNFDEPSLLYKPANPTRTGYTFTGWYKEPSCTTLWNFETDLSLAQNEGTKWDAYVETVLYAGWTAV